MGHGRDCGESQSLRSEKVVHFPPLIADPCRQEYLISIGHDSSPPVHDWIYSNSGNNQGISINTEGQCALHIAAAASQSAVVALLCQQFPHTVTRRDRRGQTPLHLASASQIVATPSYILRTGTKPPPRSPEEITCITTLLASGADVNARDELGNTCLHNASAWGNLKAVRALIQAGADPLCKNNAGWTPEFYSITVQAEVYYRGLVADWEKKKEAEEKGVGERDKERAKRKGMGVGGVRLVMRDDGSDDDGGGGAAGERERGDDGEGRSRASTSSGRSQLTQSTGGGSDAGG